MKIIHHVVDVDAPQSRLWFAVELSDDAFGIYNFNWGYYLESLRLLCVAGRGKPFQAPA